MLYCFERMFKAKNFAAQITPSISKKFFLRGITMENFEVKLKVKLIISMLLMAVSIQFKVFRHVDYGIGVLP